MKKTRVATLLSAVAAAVTLAVCDVPAASAMDYPGHIWNDSNSSNLCLGIKNNQLSGPGIMAYCNGNSDQQWYTLSGDRGASTFQQKTLVNRNNQCLTGWSKGSTVYAEDCTGGAAQNQLWYLSWQKNEGDWSYYEYINVASGLCLSVAGGSTAAGATPIMWTCQYTADQRWGGPGTYVM